MNSWDQIRNYVQSRLSQESYENWFSGATYLANEGETLVVSVPDRETRSLLETEYAAIVGSAIRDLNLPIRRVSYDPAPVRSTLDQIVPSNEIPEIDPVANTLNPKFTFESFVVGSCNQ